jgi:hypothetical protein
MHKCFTVSGVPWACATVGLAGTPTKSRGDDRRSGMGGNNYSTENMNDLALARGRDPNVKREARESADCRVLGRVAIVLVRDPSILLFLVHPPSFPLYLLPHAPFFHTPRSPLFTLDSKL